LLRQQTQRQYNNQTQKKAKIKVFPWGIKGEKHEAKSQTDPVGIASYVSMKYKHQEIDPVRRRTVTTTDPMPKQTQCQNK